ncbi:predicted protein [Arabidopsis lyrata subsp. lyrata]|uniref:Predicted protein n=1 Tax=Arabidopsis lyrata subsp. lyrata TaxID=81972 RepID=D7MR93_ARALL|nr:predicted protein [Arabidopsis lyrata subsp. lyrata]
MATRREVRCQCGRRMWVQPDVRTVQCSTCHTVTQLYSLMDIARGANRIIHGFQQLLRQHQPQHQYHEQQQQMMAQPPPRLLEPLPSPFGKKRAVLCGLNYKGKSYSLKGCISDAKSMRSFLVQQMGFPIDSILMLTDHRSVRAYKGTDGGAAFCFSACDDDETSGYTPVFTGKNTGAMTYSFIKAVKTAGPAPTYGHLLNLMCSAIREAQSRLAFNGDYASSDASAEPLLTSSDEFDLYATKFVL